MAKSTSSYTETFSIRLVKISIILCEFHIKILWVLLIVKVISRKTCQHLNENSYFLLYCKRKPIIVCSEKTLLHLLYMKAILFHLWLTFKTWIHFRDTILEIAITNFTLCALGIYLIYITMQENCFVVLCPNLEMIALHLMALCPTICNSRLCNSTPR